MFLVKFSFSEKGTKICAIVQNHKVDGANNVAFSEIWTLKYFFWLLWIDFGLIYHSWDRYRFCNPPTFRSFDYTTLIGLWFPLLNRFQKLAKCLTYLLSCKDLTSLRCWKLLFKSKTVLTVWLWYSFLLTFSKCPRDILKFNSYIMKRLSRDESWDSSSVR